MTRCFSILVIASELAVRPAAAAPAPALDALLERAGKRVEQFWEQFSAVTCLETVTQVKLSPQGKVIAQKKSTFDYVILMQLAGEDLTVEESRQEQGKPPKAADRALLATNGFSTLILVFHPHFQRSYEFTLLPEEEIDGHRMQRVRFQHVAGRRSPSVLQLKGREYPIEWLGEAWIEAQSGSVAKIAVGLKAPMDDVGLRKLESEVRYVPVPLKGLPAAAWLPEMASIEAGTLRQRWKNVHQFSRFRQFSVGVDVRIEDPK